MPLNISNPPDEGLWTETLHLRQIRSKLCGSLLHFLKFLYTAGETCSPGLFGIPRDHGASRRAAPCFATYGAVSSSFSRTFQTRRLGLNHAFFCMRGQPECLCQSWLLCPDALRQPTQSIVPVHHCAPNVHSHRWKRETLTKSLPQAH